MTHPSDRPPLHAVPDPDAQDLGRTPPHDADAERAVLGALLTDPTTIEPVIDTLQANDFYRPAHALIYDVATGLWAAGNPVDPVTVTTELQRRGDLGTVSRSGGARYVWELTDAITTTTAAPYYAQIVREKADLRRIVDVGTQLVQLGHSSTGHDARALLDDATHRLTQARPPRPTDPLLAADIDTFLATTDPDHAWLIPGLLERQDRFILTAAEGDGKSTFLRQFGVQSAAGIHPLTGDTITPIRVLQVDLENSERQTRRELRPLRTAAGAMTPGNYRIVCKLDGLDLTTPDDQAWLDRLLTTTSPDLLITGPIYKLAGGNPNDEKDAKPGAMYLDKLRARHDVALLLEAHAAKAPVGSKQRPIEPFGWSGWLRWPEFGVNLGPTNDDGIAEIKHWRGMREATRTFPTHLKRGGDWPWTPEKTGDDYDWSLIARAIRDANRVLSVRELETATGLNRNRVQRLKTARSTDWTVLVHSLEVTP